MGVGSLSRVREALLAHHRLYRTFRRITGSAHVNEVFVEQYVKPSEGDQILDLGCGPGDVFELMPAVNYLGIDLSEDYIRAAIHRFAGRARFIHGDINAIATQGLGPFDAVLGMGVMHHLNDEEVLCMLENIRRLLRPRGRFISYDPGFTERQHPFARWIHKKDRGKFVRFDDAYERLISRIFRSYRRHIRTDLCTVPATVIIFECETDA